VTNFLKIRFTKHAREKFTILKRHKFSVSRQAIFKTIRRPDYIDYSRFPLKIAQKPFDKTHVLRVVYKEENGEIVVITFYPGRKSQYEEQ